MGSPYFSVTNLADAIDVIADRLQLDKDTLLVRIEHQERFHHGLQYTQSVYYAGHQQVVLSPDLPDALRPDSKPQIVLKVDDTDPYARRLLVCTRPEPTQGEWHFVGGIGLGT